MTLAALRASTPLATVTATGPTNGDITITRPGATQNGDWEVVALTPSKVGTTITVDVVPTGWTERKPLTLVNNAGMVVYEHIYTTGDPNPTFSVSDASGVMVVALYAAYSGARLGGTVGAYNTTASGSTVTAASLTTVIPDCVILALGSHKASTSATSVSASPDASTVISSVNNGSTQMSAYMGAFNKAAAGATNAQIIDWAGATATSMVGLQIAITPTTHTAPTANAGADVTNGAVGNVVSRTGTGTPFDSTTIAEYDWSLDTSAPGNGVPPGSTITNGSLSGATSATVSLTPDIQGIYVLRLRVKDSAGVWSAYDTVKIYVPGTSIRPYTITSNPGSWDQYGSVTDAITAWLDSDNTTGMSSDTGTANPSKIVVRLEPMATPTTFWQLDLGQVLLAAGAGTITIRLKEGATTRKTWTPAGAQIPTTTPGVANYPLTGGEMATVGSWLDLDLEIEKAP